MFSVVIWICTNVVLLDIVKKGMDKIRISAVKYANTYPFIYGLIKSGFDKKVILETDHPADCAKKLIDGRVDVGLIPVATIPLLSEYHIVSDYCIGANGEVLGESAVLELGPVDGRRPGRCRLSPPLVKGVSWTVLEPASRSWSSPSSSPCSACWRASACRT